MNFSLIPGPVIQLANGSKILTDKLKDPLTLTYNNLPFPLEFTLIDHLVYPIILGMDFFYCFETQINFSQGFISINQAPIKLQLVKNLQYCMEKTSNLSSLFPLSLIPDLNEKKFESKLNFNSDFELVPSPQKFIFHSTNSIPLASDRFPCSYSHQVDNSDECFEPYLNPSSNSFDHILSSLEPLDSNLNKVIDIENH